MAPTGVDLLGGVEDGGVEGCAREGGVALLSVTSGRPIAKEHQLTERDELRKGHDSNYGRHTSVCDGLCLVRIE